MHFELGHAAQPALADGAFERDVPLDRRRSAGHRTIRSRLLEAAAALAVASSEGRASVVAPVSSFLGLAPDVRVRQDVRMLDHFSIQCADFAASAEFYDVVLAPLGGVRVMDFGEAIGFGASDKPDFWIGVQATGDGFRESHVAFAAEDRAAVDAFFAAAVGAGAEVLHEPRVWPEYHPNYYGAFVRDPDGNNIEAVCHTAEL
jgi:catechol 2,3-dioxygenase-like lactoylglutathione lyase family enzyme